MYTIDDRQISKPYPLGVTTEYGRTYFSVVMKKGKDCGIILYDKKTGKESRIPFSEQNKYGSIYSLAIKELDIGRYAYNFYNGEEEFTDPYAKLIFGHDKWGKCDKAVRGGFLINEFDWEGDKPLKNAYEDTVMYCLNVRAFTRHKSSGVQHKGTFRGIAEKLPYLKELGITAIELMPAYEFDETEGTKRIQDKAPSMEDARNSFKDPVQQWSEGMAKTQKLNCWGYIEGYYFAPKAAFGAGRDTAFELKSMVKELHKNGIEVVMQFYFPNSVNQGLILETVKYWVLEYHIDGIHLKGDRIPIGVIATEPLLTDTKIFYCDFSCDAILEEDSREYHNIASYQDDYMYAVRRFLKGDENLIGYFLELQRRNPESCKAVNYVTNYYGFTLADMVSYERKHNEANGENNLDGSNENYAWNCGVEGATRRNSVKQLRLRQMKNALTMLFMSQGVPLIYSGDELGNTRYGNNNPYCQDNETGFVKWNTNSMGASVFSYIKDLITLRKEHPVLKNARELKVLDYIGCGYPDLSYHGEEAWRPDLSNYSRYAGVMYCGCYAKKSKLEDDNFFYIAYNMHWVPHTFALPNLPKGMKWCLVADTGAGDTITITKELTQASEEQLHVEVKARTVHIYISKQEEGRKSDKRKQYAATAF